ncbi:DUF2793 domain-containing protein [Rhizobium tubonense]|uniref:Uncharacterized protein n=1 Tax=Rhizobium tubonense TaxID=484088 RepID=A0A2W4CUQ4_9HYPH|nr:DUF2793 domain-containing protein [Rhizobium tubonense]PZM14035.1 hypothetical protein CPY51_14430 [Rhizobium tubonense]
MSDQTNNLALPYILPSQAQKHVTHNEALQRLDAIVQLTIAARSATPPPSPVEGACYLIDASSAGAWAGKSGLLALRQDGAWIFIQPRDGWQAWFRADARLRVLLAGQWQETGLPANGAMHTLGINATADTATRLAVSAAATLFNNAGNGHQIKVNKQALADTASLLFQTNWSGRAEMGIAGNDDFAIKVSPDGNGWQTGLQISSKGIVTTPNRPLVRAFLVAAAATPVNGTQTGFSQLGANQGGFALGDTLGGTLGNRLSVPASGNYLLTLNTSLLTSGGHSASLVANGTTVLATSGAAATTGAFRQSTTGMASLVAGDRLSLLHSGTAQFEFGSGKTEIVAYLL